MSDNIVQLPTSTRGDYFGGCPACRRTNGCISDGADHWYVCDAHKVKWLVGSNLFSGWRDLTAEQRFKNRDTLAQYREVEPVSDWVEREGEVSSDNEPPF